jgi:hypothetical protein
MQLLYAQVVPQDIQEMAALLAPWITILKHLNVSPALMWESIALSALHRQSVLLALLGILEHFAMSVLTVMMEKIAISA